MKKNRVIEKIKDFLGITAWLAAIMLLACSCSDSLDIHTRYLFDLETMPVPKRIVQGETAEIRCTLVKEGNYEQAKFYIRYFQPDGVGELKMDNGTVLLPNDLYPLDRTTFRLYYICHRLKIKCQSLNFSFSLCRLSKGTNLTAGPFQII